MFQYAQYTCKINLKQQQKQNEQEEKSEVGVRFDRERKGERKKLQKEPKNGKSKQAMPIKRLNY